MVQFMPELRKTLDFGEDFFRYSFSRKPLVQIEIADGFAGVGRFLRLLDRFLKLLFQKISGVLLRLHRLAKDGFAAAVLFFHGLGSCLEIIEHLGLDSGRMRDDSFSRGIDLKNCTAAW